MKSVKEVVRSIKHPKVKINYTVEYVIEYKKAQAIVRRTIRKARRDFWKEYCNTIGNETSKGKVWRMIRRMDGEKKDLNYTVLIKENVTALINKKKVKLMARVFAQINSSNNLSEEDRLGRERTKMEYAGMLCKKNNL